MLCIHVRSHTENGRKVAADRLCRTHRSTGGVLVLPHANIGMRSGPGARGGGEPGPPGRPWSRPRCETPSRRAYAGEESEVP
jgi:hypothetical protein